MRATAILVACALVLTPLGLMAPTASAAGTVGQFLWPTGPYGSYGTQLDADDNNTFASALTPVSRDWYDAQTEGTIWRDWWPPSDEDDDNFYDATPGSIWFGQTLDEDEPSDTGTFGMADVRISLSDLSDSLVSTTDYWTLTVYVAGMMTGGPLDSTGTDDPWGPLGPTTRTNGTAIYVGWGFTGERQTETVQWLNDTPLAHRSLAEIGSSSMFISLLTRGTVDPATAPELTDMMAEPYGRPFTSDEVDDAFLWLRFRFDQYITYTNEDPGDYPPYRFKVGFILVYATPTDYTPPADPGSFILWPNDDVQNTGWINYTTDDRVGCYGTMNESGWFGDGNLSYSGANYGSTKLLRLGFTDVPEGVPASARFSVSLHIIARIVAFPGSAAIISNVLTTGGMEFSQSVGTPMYQWWTNYTHAVQYSPVTGETWTVAELDTMQVVLTNYKDPDGATPGEMQVTQVLAICTPTEDYSAYFPPSFDPIDYDDVSGWLAYGHGLSTIFAIMGGMGMFLAAPFIAMSVRDGRYGAWEGIVLGIVIFVTSFALFIAGTAPWS